MKFSSPLIPATLIKRYKRFLADVLLSSGQELTVHTPNTGSMLGVCEPGMTVWLRDTDNPQRKYRYSWEMSEPTDGVYVGVHTGLVNQLVSEAILSGIIADLRVYSEIQQEVKYGRENSRIDLLLRESGLPDCYVEIKNVTAVDKRGQAIFPDAVTRRGQKHLRELMAVVKSGQRAIILFCVQRSDVRSFRPADEIDAAYGGLLRLAIAQGVEAIACKARVSPESITLTQTIPVII